MKDIAWSDGRPLCIEVTTAASRDVYARRGSKVVAKVSLGKGQVNPDALVKKDAEGVTVWPMVRHLALASSRGSYVASTIGV
ncbi:hypothetical protein F4814DRAFT_413155 [Daldinia grandis]|nr:hypothetical protein F4814DRAFT_413155 [Daldinia grandis]